MHVTLRARTGLPSLRATRVFDAVRDAIAVASGEQFRVVHFSVQHDHVHSIVEADDRRSLSLGIRGLVIRLARAVNRVVGRTGSVWADRYHARALRTPVETRNALLYVIQNWKKHIRGASGVDGRSSGPWFEGWAKPLRPPSARSPVAGPRTWLATRGWRDRGGGPLRTIEAPARTRD